MAFAVMGHYLFEGNLEHIGATLTILVLLHVQISFLDWLSCLREMTFSKQGS